MLRLDDMAVQHEAGGKWTGLTVKSVHPNVDLGLLKGILENELQEIKPDFCGWWYCCIPLRNIADDNLPLPLFIKIDDIEYGLRNTPKLLFLTGLGVWHEPFVKKEKAYLDYYNVRNKLILNNIYNIKWGVHKSMFLLAYYLGKNLLTRIITWWIFLCKG